MLYVLLNEFILSFNKVINFMNIKEKNIVITSAVRTAIGTFSGSLKNMHGALILDQ